MKEKKSESEILFISQLSKFFPLIFCLFNFSDKRHEFKPCDINVEI